MKDLRHFLLRQLYAATFNDEERNMFLRYLKAKHKLRGLAEPTNNDVFMFFVRIGGAHLYRLEHEVHVLAFTPENLWYTGEKIGRPPTFEEAIYHLLIYIEYRWDMLRRHLRQLIARVEKALA